MDYQVNLYRVYVLHPDYATRAWAWGLLREAWHRDPMLKSR